MEEFIQQRMNRPFRLVLQVSSIEEITSEEPLP